MHWKLFNYVVITEHILSNFKEGQIESLYKEVYPSLILYASRCLGESYSFLAEDIVQEAIYKIYGIRDVFHGPAHFKSYLYNTIHNEAVSIQRKGNSRLLYLSEKKEQYVDMRNSIIEQETLDLLFNAIDHLPEELRQVFELSFEQGLKNEEVAKKMHCSTSTIKNRKKSIITYLRQCVSPKTINLFFIFFPV